MKHSLLWVLGVTSACAASDGTSPGDSAPAGPDAPAGYVELLAGEWQMPAGQEGYYCVRATVPETIYIKEFKPIAPDGTHHTALSVDTSNDPDGVFPCSASSVGFQILFGSGVGTEPFALPEGVAFRLEKGTRVLLNLHLYNATDTDLVGTSGVEVRLANKEEVIHEAETVYALSFDLEVPPGESVHRSKCTIQEETTVFGTFPHMHRLGTRMVGTARRSNGETLVIHDAPYDFESQLNYLVEPAVTLQAGDEVDVECHFSNPGPNTVTFGDSSDDEMCVLGLYRYPARGGLGLCSG